MMKSTIVSEAFSRPQHYKDMILHHQIAPMHQSFTGKTFICVSLTRFCPVGCKFCFFKSAQTFKKPTVEDSFSKGNIKNFIEFANGVNLGYLLVSGGGEPMIQRKEVIEVIQKVKSERIVLVTSANWAKTMKQTKSYISDIADAIEKRTSKTLVTVRVSLDTGHSDTIGNQPMKNLIELFEKEYQNHPSLELQIHTIYGDPSVDLLCKDLKDIYNIERLQKFKEKQSDGHSVVKVVPKRETIKFNNYEIKVGYAKIFYSNLKVDLRNHEDIQKNIDVYQKDLFESEDGNSAIVTNKIGENGLDFWVNYNGNVTTWGNQQLDNLFNVHEDSPEKVIHESLKDVAALSFIEKGAIYRDAVINEVNKTSVTRSKAVNIRDYTGALLLDEARTRLYYTVRSLQDYIQEGRINNEMIQSWPKEIQDLVACSKDELIQAYQKCHYTIVTQVLEQPFNKELVLDYLEWLHLGHYDVCNEQIDLLVKYYNANVQISERIDNPSQAKPAQSFQNSRMTEYLTHIKPSLKPQKQSANLTQDEQNTLNRLAAHRLEATTIDSVLL
jgi:MoaA/NifB/PqqE/SkfB family radical SAM enzyme